MCKTFGIFQFHHSASCFPAIIASFNLGSFFRSRFSKANGETYKMKQCRRGPKIMTELQSDQDKQHPAIHKVATGSLEHSKSSRIKKKPTPWNTTSLLDDHIEAPLYRLKNSDVIYWLLYWYYSTPNFWYQYQVIPTDTNIGFCGMNKSWLNCNVTFRMRSSVKNEVR